MQHGGLEAAGFASGACWVPDQALRGLMQFDAALAAAGNAAAGTAAGARDYVHHIAEVCNYVRAVERLDWVALVPPGSQVLDLGCGAGWLAALLSRLEAVDTVYALDASRHYVRGLLPEVLPLLGGRPEKVRAIEALFTPLLFPDGALDVVCAASALHHAENLEAVLRELRRVLKPGGLLVVLNETPRPGWRHLVSIGAASLRILRDLAREVYHPQPPAISAAGWLYDPRLGDRDYPRWYWEAALQAAGFRVEAVLDTGLPTLAGVPGRPLIHFVGRAV